MFLALSAALVVLWPGPRGTLLSQLGVPTCLLLLVAHVELVMLGMTVGVLLDAAMGSRFGRMHLALATAAWALLTLDLGSWGLRLIAGLDLTRDYLVALLQDWSRIAVLTTPTERLVLYSLPLAGAAVTVGLLRVPWPKPTRRSVRPASLLVVGLGAAVACGHLATSRNSADIYDHRTARWATVGEVYRLALEGQGPWLPHMVFAGGSQPALEARRPENAAYVRVGDPVYSLDRWADRIDRDRFSAKNVVLIQIDSLRWNELAQTGGDPRTLPVLSQWAASNLLFDRCYAPTSETAYSLPAMLDGQYALRRPVRDYHDDVSYPSVALAQVLRAAGYRTALFSSHRLGWQKMNRVIRPEQYDAYVGLDAVPSILASGGAPRWLEEADRSSGVAARITRDLESANDFDRIGAELFAGWAAAGGGRPFFAVLAQIAAHYPYRWPPELEAPFTPFERSKYATFFSYPLEAVGVMRNAYRNALHYDDLVLARVMDTLEQLGVADRTIVIVASDHAQSFGEHGLVTHARGPFESQIRTPMVIIDSGRAPARIDSPVSMIDIAPTVLDLLGLPEHAAFQGYSVFDAARQARRPIYFSMQSPMTKQEAVIARGFKYIEDFATGKLSSFDLVHDPGETHNLMEEEPPPAMALRLQRDLRAWHMTQLVYYASPELYQHFFPPRYPDLVK